MTNFFFSLCLRATQPGQTFGRLTALLLLALLPVLTQAQAPVLTSVAPNTGPLETRVTITGQNLTGLTSVLVGAMLARFTVNSATSATAIVPRQAVNQPLRITRTSGPAASQGTALSTQTFAVTRTTTVGVFPQQPDLTTDGTNALNVGRGASPLATDLDGDGLLDLVVGNYYGTVRRYEQTTANGGVFGLVGFVTTDGTNALNVGFKSSPAVTDLDGDGLLDLLVWEFNSGSGSVQRFEQTVANGDVFAPFGTLTTDGSTPLEVILGYAAPTVTDVDNNGLLDLLMGTSRGNVERFEQTVANGTEFAPMGPLTTDGTNALNAGTYATPTVTDMDGDGRLDLLVANLDGNVTRFEQTEANGAVFALVGPLTTNGTTALDAGSFAAPTVTDVDGDGLLDLLLFNDEGSVQRYEQAAAAPLPVELTTFTATPAGPTAVRLAWATTSEKNSARFEVERSADGVTFASIGTVPAAGSSATPRSYKLLDTQLPAGATLLYYRLRQVDQDATANYSPVRTVALTGAAAGLALFPNPTHGAATLTGAQPGAVVTVLDALGRAVLTTPADAAGTAVLALPPGLANGVYIVRTGSQALRLTVE